MIKKTIAFLFLFFTRVAFSQFNISSEVFLGIDVLQQSSFSKLQGKKVALLTNHAGRNREGKLTLEILKDAENIELAGVFVPEHGFFTTIPAGEKVEDDEVFGIKAYSLYGKGKSPDDNLLSKCDVVIVDLQDIGIRSYTYLSTMYNTLKACASASKPVILLDRPNPIGGMIVDGGILDEGISSFVGIVPVSYIHGMTFGELANMINEEGWLGKGKDGTTLKCHLEVIKMTGWERWMAWEDTGLFWFPTSPHIPTIDAVRGAAVLGPLGELGIISIGIGTTSPFQYLGSPGFSYKDFDGAIGHCKYNGLILDKAIYQPFYGMYNGKSCTGYYLKFGRDNLFRPYSDGIRIMCALNSSNSSLFAKLSDRSKDMFRKVTGKADLLRAISSGMSVQAVIEIANKGIEGFLDLRKKYLLYS